jgi:hypothetical protein
MTWDGQHIWIIDQPSSSSNPALATELDLNGNIVSTITLPDHYMSGIAYDNGDFWVCTYYPDPGTIYKIDELGNVLTQFQSPGEQPWDICLENGDLWVADYYDNMLYKIDMSGTILESQPSDNIKPSGIVYDDNYLWYCDGQISTNPSILYKVDLGGAGTPAINVPVTSHDYGMVTIGTSPPWNMFVSNTGSAPLIINDISIPVGTPVYTTASMPISIPEGTNVSIPLIYNPNEPVPLDVVVEIVSNDPVNPGVPIELTGHGLIPGPSAMTGVTSHNYGLVRNNAHTRWFYELKNVGDEMLQVSGFSSPDEAFYLFPDQAFPINIAPLQTALIGVWFNPEEAISYVADCELSTNDPENLSIILELDGEGLKKEWLIGNILWSYIIQQGFDNSPKAISYIKDVTYDSVSDVIVCSEDYHVRCFNGNSHGTADIIWEKEIYSGSVYSTHGLDIADLDGDDVEDVIIGTTGGDRSIRAMDGKTGDLMWMHQTNEYGGGGWVYQVNCSFDYNDDGHVDVLASTGDDGGGTGPKRIYCLDALSGESIWECFTDGPNFSCIGVEDFTGDGKPDAIGGSSNSSENEGHVYGIDGASGTIMWDFVTSGTSVWAIIQLDDINGDNVKDIAVGDGVIPGGHIYYLNAKNGDMLHAANLGHTINHFARMDDINDDGYKDILVAYGGFNGVVLSGLDASTLWLRSVADKAWVADVIDDINGDGFKDAVIGTLFTNNYCYFMNGENGDELFSTPYSSPVDAISGLPDIVGDETMEMVVGGRDGRLICYSGGVNLAVDIQSPFNDFDQLSATCYPNPFNAAAGEQNKISYSLNEGGHVVIQLFDSRGTCVKTLNNAPKQKGIHVVEWNGRDDNGGVLPPGLYYCSIKCNGAFTSLKISIL